MTYELIITEKPNAAKMIATALADGKAIKEAIQGVPYYKISHNKKDIVVGCAVGHLYTVAEKEKSFKYPSFDILWKATSDVDPKSFTKKYLTTLKKLAKDAAEFTVATDYDIEGEVIGLNCIRYACKQKDASRMKFSTLTKNDIVQAYNNKHKTLDWGQALAGETRHYLDWMYGMNISRALTLAIKNSGMYKTMSSGRVQGPALKLVVEKEKEIKAFVSQKYWEIQVNGAFQNFSSQTLEAGHEKGKMFSEDEALKILSKVKGKNGTITKIQKSQFIQKTPVPFDLTTLQMESYRLFHISPKETLEIAQELYTGGFISYPRTSSQKLPKEIGYKPILEGLKKHKDFEKFALELINKEKKQKGLIPSEGKKTDPAHPAIYPTGNIPHCHERPFKVYDLIVKRFFACFGEDAQRETVTINIEIEKEPFITRGTTTIHEGWHKYYHPYVKLEEQLLPAVKEKDTFINKETIKHDKETQPPRRFSPASIIKELEKQNLGTKATRAAIVDTLYQRNYVKNESIEATELGINTVATLEKFCPEILDVKLTRHFEIEMDKIREGKYKEEQVLEEAKKTLIKILEKFKKNEKSIGKELNESHREGMEKESYIGPCPVCKEGNLRITYSRKTKKKFIACDKYPDCKTIFNLPNFGIAKNTEKICEQCKYPIIKIIAGRRTQESCLNPQCPSKKSEDKEVQNHIDALESGKIVKKCPKCGKDMILRRSMYGQFLGCSGYPKCRSIEKLPKTADEINNPASIYPAKTKKTTKSKKSALAKTKQSAVIVESKEDVKKEAVTDVKKTSAKKSAKTKKPVTGKSKPKDVKSDKEI